MKNWQTQSDLTMLAEYAPQESGSSEHKEHFWDHVTKTMAKLPRRNSIIFGGYFNGDPIPDDAAVGWQHPCKALTDNGSLGVQEQQCALVDVDSAEASAGEKSGRHAEDGGLCMRQWRTEIEKHFDARLTCPKAGPDPITRE